MTLYLDEAQEEAKQLSAQTGSGRYFEFIDPVSCQDRLTHILCIASNFEPLVLQDLRQEQLKVHSSPWEALTRPYLLPSLNK